MIKSKFLRETLEHYGSLSMIDPARLGEISEDRSAVIGRDGWCFIYEGTNNYRGLYHDTDIASLGEQWARLIEHRQKVCEEKGIKFAQLIVPNKATVMPEKFPESLGDGITPILKRLIDANPIANFYALLKICVALLYVIVPFVVTIAI